MPNARRRPYAPGMTTRPALALSALAALAALAGCGSDDADPAPAKPDAALPAAFDACTTELDKALVSSGMASEAVSGDFLQLAGDERTLTVGNAPQGGDLSAPLTIPAVACLLDELDAPSSVMSKMQQTRALDGQQAEAWDDYEVTWTYHPDDGLSAVFTDGSS